MLPDSFSLRRVGACVFSLLALVWLAACDVAPISTGIGQTPALDTSRPVRVALLVPGGSSEGGDRILAENLENAARLAVADLAGVQIDLAVYNTGGQAGQAAAAARQASAEGARIILGPLHREAAVAASTAVAGQGINVLSFSNTSSIAGGNLFLLGQTYETAAQRLISYAASQGITRLYIAAAQGPGGDLGRQAITSAARAVGAQVVGTTSYPLSQQDIMAATDVIAAQARAAGAQAIVTTAQPGAELAILGTILPEKGIRSPQTRFIGLTRWNAAPEMLQTPGLEGGYFALPDRTRLAAFESRYEARYGAKPHPLAGLAYDGIAAIGALVATGRADALSRGALTGSAGFQGTSGVFRFLRNGLNERGLAVATVSGGRTQIVSPAPFGFGRGIN